jgi:ectoine hydroxylase-related dioxygenase (phytanoyl-CoA dioxygenase family)
MSPDPRRVRQSMARDGAAVLGRLFPRSLLEEARRLVTRRHTSGELRRRGLVRDIAGRCTSVLPFEGPFLKPAFYANPRVLDIMGALLGADFCIGSLEVVIALPGALRQHQHVDGALRFDQVVGKKKRFFGGDLSGLPPYAVGLATPLCDVTEENGPTAIWLGSHRVALRPKLPGERAIGRDFPMKAMTAPFGSSYVFDYRVLHGGLPNDSREPRPLLMLVFTRSWYRDPNQNEVFPSVVISKAALARIPEGRRRLFLLAPAARRALWNAQG